VNDIEVAVFKGHLDIVRLLIEHGHTVIDDTIHHAITGPIEDEEERLELLKYLLSQYKGKDEDDKL
jgi:hypothetical protein